MSHEHSDLAVRHHTRYLCDLPVRLGIAAVSAPAVRLASAIDGRVPAQLVDLSKGGVGLRTGMFFPIDCCLTVVLAGHDCPPLEATVRIRRIGMTDRKPTYYIGASFENPSAATQAEIGRLLQWLRDSGAARPPEKASA